MPGAEALHLQTGSASGPGPINIASADLRRPSNVSAASMPGLESVGGMFGSVDGQVPPLLCKFLVHHLLRLFSVHIHASLALIDTTAPFPQIYPHSANLQSPVRHHMSMPSAHIHRP